MKQYEPRAFIENLNSRIQKQHGLICPFCGGDRFTTTENMATILVGQDFGNINIGPTVPAGMVICEKCGHVDFFALGVLGLLEKEEE